MEKALREKSILNKNQFLISSTLFTKLLSSIFPASFDQNNTQPGSNIDDNDVLDVISKFLKKFL